MVAALCGVLLFVVFWVLPSHLNRLPRSVVNLPHREYWLKVENWPRAQRMLGDGLGWIDAAMFVYCGYAFWSRVR